MPTATSKSGGTHCYILRSFRSNLTTFDLVSSLDFGDCHRSIFAHEDSIQGLQFVSKTHLFFSCARDGKVKQWDADNFENVITLTGHHGQVSSLAVSDDGKYVCSAGHDHSLRLWHRTQEPLILEDERETQREAEADQVNVFFISPPEMITISWLAIRNLCSIRAFYLDAVPTNFCVTSPAAFGPVKLDFHIAQSFSNSRTTFRVTNVFGVRPKYRWSFYFPC